MGNSTSLLTATICRFLLPVLALALITAALPTGLAAAPKTKLWPKWQVHDATSKLRVDHQSWQLFLNRYLDTKHISGVHRVRYAKVSPADKKELAAYLTRLQAVGVSALDRPEQMAYWINLYNAFTLQTVLDHYPVKSIRDINISPGLFAKGPWGAKLLTVEGQKISLDDIEHRILRPIFKDNRIHYAVNCASVGCPNLQPRAFTRSNSEQLLTTGAREYVNHPRGVQERGGKLILSSIYKWFKSDFGSSKEQLLAHLASHAAKPLSRHLTKFKGTIKYEYDWTLNQ